MSCEKTALYTLPEETVTATHDKNNTAAFGRSHTSWSEMLTKWLTFTALLVGSVNPQSRGTLTVAPTCRVKGQPEAELMLNCGDGKNAGVVQYWHTPFGELQTPGFHHKLDPVFLDHDRSLVVPNSSVLHSGLYYCLLQHTQGATLWPYELHIHHTSQKKQDHRGYEQSSSCAGLRLSRGAGPEEVKQEGVSDGLFAGAVAGSVLLSFVVGFSTGALTRTHVLRCLQVVTMRLRSPRQQRCQIDTQDHRPDVTMTTTLPMYDNQAFEIGRAQDDVSVSRLSPPAKPQRSFRHKQEQQGPTAYLEGCGCTAEEERRTEEEVPGTSLEQKNKECDREAEEQKIFYLLGGDGGSQLDSDEKGGRGSMDEKQERRQNGEEAGEEERRGSDEEEKRGDKEKEEDDREKNREEDVCSDSTETDDDETENQDTMENEAPPSPPRPVRRSRVIRLYQYDEDGQRYSHLPDASPDDPGPAPRLRQRSLSLTRLNAIMAAVSAGPLDRRETGKEERPHFHMEI
ncbi:uncharacterized protein LOC113122203 [Mastacembelus armatus]|uniref:uncharacterized protein LOC113122203 n=1 Tax=Mastacembelus armatus TaxID=205130 RepID=UPI000E45D653|nr:uncharacterized protein LOC113122203 [Mastacembelus armatus]